MKRRDFIKVAGSIALTTALTPGKSALAGSTRLSDKSLCQSETQQLTLHGREGGHSGPGISEDSVVALEVGLSEMNLRFADYRDME